MAPAQTRGNGTDRWRLETASSCRCRSCGQREAIASGDLTARVGVHPASGARPPLESREGKPMRVLDWLLGPEALGESKKTHLLARWIVLRAIGLIYFSAFYSLLFQIKGLMGPQGILPVAQYLPAVAEQLPGWHRFWFAPTLLWWSSG